METSSVIVVASTSQAEQLLLAGDIGCPGCNAALRPHGHGRTRTVRGVGAQRVTTRPAEPGAVTADAPRSCCPPSSPSGAPTPPKPSETRW